MSKSILSAPHFHNEDAAFAYVEAHLWPHGPVCFHCKGTERISKMNGKTTRPGLYKCYACRKPFTVRMGSIFESSHVPLRVWLQIIYLVCSSKKGISTRQIHRIIGGSLKTAWFLSHRIRAAMGSDDLPPMGGDFGIVESDETYIGRIAGVEKKRGGSHKNIVLTLVERGGSARSFHIGNASNADIMPILKANVMKKTVIMTDEAGHYSRVYQHFAAHSFTNHGAKEYVRGDIHTNTVEGFYSIFKRGMKGIYQHCAEKHLFRYLAEFDFRYTNRERLGVDDIARASNALKGFAGKRLTYRTTDRLHSALA
jgi:transposase-like protein